MSKVAKRYDPSDQPPDPLSDADRRAIALAAARGVFPGGVSVETIQGYLDDAHAALLEASLWRVIISQAYKDSWLRRVEGGADDGDVIFGIGPLPDGEAT